MHAGIGSKISREKQRGRPVATSEKCGRNEFENSLLDASRLTLRAGLCSVPPPREKIPSTSADKQRPLAQVRKRSTDSAAVRATGTMFVAASISDTSSSASIPDVRRRLWLEARVSAGTRGARTTVCDRSRPSVSSAGAAATTGTKSRTHRVPGAPGRRSARSLVVAGHDSHARADLSRRRADRLLPATQRRGASKPR